MKCYSVALIVVAARVQGATNGKAHHARKTHGQRGLRSLSLIRLWIGGTASSRATWGFPFVLGLAMLDGLLSPTRLGSALAMRTLAFLAALPISGVMADQSGARRVELPGGGLCLLANSKFVRGDKINNN